MTTWLGVIDARGGVAPLLGQNWSHMGDRFSARNAQFDTGEMAILGGLVVGAGLLIWALNWAANHQANWFRRPSPKRLFRELCRTHGLVRAERRVMKLLADHHGVASPAELFLRPELFEPARLPAELRHQEEIVASIAGFLFAEAQPAPKQPAAKPQAAAEEAEPAGVS